MMVDRRSNSMSTVEDKEPTIFDLLERLRERLGPNAFHVVVHWECDLCAVGIANPRDHVILAYVSTLNRTPGRY
jgi:hypothetical protein